MASYIFSFLCYIGLRDEMMKNYAFRPCLPYYLLRNPQFKSWKEGLLVPQKNEISGEISQDEDSIRMHLITSIPSKLSKSNEIRKSITSNPQRNSLQRQIVLYGYFIKRAKRLSSSKRQVFPLDQNPSIDVTFTQQSDIKHYTVLRDKEKYQEHTVELIFEEFKQSYDLPKVDKLRVVGFYLPTQSYTSSEEIIGSIFIEFEEKSDFVILYSHGNSSDIGMCIDILLDLAFNLSVNVFAYEFSGFGQTTGVANDVNAVYGIQAAYKFLTEQLGFKWHQIILYGYSIGSGPTITLVKILINVSQASLREYPVLGIVLQSGLASGLRTISSRFSTTHYWDIFPNCDLIEVIKAPMFIMHGKKDDIIKYTVAEILRKKARNVIEFWLPEDGDHYNMDISQNLRGEYFKRLKDFMKYIQSQENPKKKDFRSLPLNESFQHMYRELFYQNDVDKSSQSGVQLNQSSQQLLSLKLMNHEYY